MSVCSDLSTALVTLSCHADMFRAVGPVGLVLYAPLAVPLALAVCAMWYAFKPAKRATWRYDNVTFPRRTTTRRRY